MAKEEKFTFSLRMYEITPDNCEDMLTPEARWAWEWVDQDGWAWLRGLEYTEPNKKKTQVRALQALVQMGDMLPKNYEIRSPLDAPRTKA